MFTWVASCNIHQVIILFFSIFNISGNFNNSPLDKSYVLGIGGWNAERVAFKSLLYWKFLSQTPVGACHLASSPRSRRVRSTVTAHSLQSLTGPECVLLRSLSPCLPQRGQLQSRSRRRQAISSRIVSTETPASNTCKAVDVVFHACCAWFLEPA